MLTSNKNQFSLISTTHKKILFGPHSFAKYFFPPNFSFVFWKREIWREKIYSSKE
jgi:hypothetical protein